MFFIPGWLVSIITFPGVIVHELGHKLFADFAALPVYEVKYFQFKNPAGYVAHGETNDLKKSFIVTTGPFLLNSVLCFLICFSAGISYYWLKIEQTEFLSLAILWLGVSIGMHAFPSNHDLENFTNLVHINYSERKILQMFSKVFAFTFITANTLRIFWIDVLYAFLIGFLLPYGLIKAGILIYLAIK